MKKIFIAVIFCCLSIYTTTAQLNTGDIMFVGFRFDGNVGDLGCGDGFAFVALADIPANTDIHFTEEEYLGTAFGTEEGDVTWNHTSVVTAGTVIEITTNVESDIDECGIPDVDPSANIGSVQYTSFQGGGWSAGTSNEEIYAYLGAVRFPTTWLCGMFTDNLDNSNTPPAELSGFILDFSNVDQDVDLGIMTGGLNCPDAPACLANILDLNNWTLEDGGGANCCDADGVDYPEDIPGTFSFTIPTTFEDLSNVCLLGGVATGLTGGTPTGGVYSGTGVTDDGNGMTFSFDPGAVGPGTHTITYTTNGQSATSTITLSIPVEINVVGLEDVKCNGASSGFIFTSTMNGGGSNTYLWSDGSTGSGLSSVSVGTYTVTVTDGDGCTDTATGTISEPTALAISITVDAHSCDGMPTGAATASATGGTPPYTFGWGTGSSTNSGLGPGTYSITIFDANDCELAGSVTIDNVPLPTVAYVAPSNFCIDAGVQAGLAGGTPVGGEYSGVGVTDDGNGMTYSFDPSVAGIGTQSITYSYSDANNCMASSLDDIEVFDVPTVSITLDDTIYVIDGTFPIGIGGGLPVGGVYSDPYNEITDDGNGMTFSINSTAAIGELNNIIYTFTDPTTGCTNTASQVIRVLAFTDVEDLEKVNLEIFPNPTNGIISLIGEQTDRIEVIDINGKILRIETTPTNTLDLSSLPSGIYFLRINVADQIVTSRIVKE